MNSTLSSRCSGADSIPRLLTVAAVTFAWLFGWAGLACSKPPTHVDSFPTLKERLVHDGFERTFLENLYARPEVSFDQQGISTYFRHREATLNYDQFLTPGAIDQTLDYFRQHEEVLTRVQKQYGVDAEVICAIILVETRLGTVVGSRLVLNTLSTLAALDDTDIRDRLWITVIKEKTDRPKAEFDAWAARKSAWAYGELKAYLQYISSQGLDPVFINGSFAGALGIAQFIPTSVLRFARDGNQDGKINLYHHEDAIESIANYLRENGWRPSLSRDQALKVILRYNNSTYYAETILKVADRVSEGRRK